MIKVSPETPWSARDLRWWGAIALEQSLPRSILSRVQGADGLEEFVGRELSEGRMRKLGDELSLSLEHEQRVLRALTRRGELETLARTTAKLLEARSVSDIPFALQTGDLSGFRKVVGLRRLPRAVALPSPAEWLRRSVCAAFDAAWFEETWAEQASVVADEVLDDALDGPIDVGPLRAWVAARGPNDRLVQDALLRGDPIETEDDARRSIVAFAAGDAGTARRLFERGFEGALRKRRDPLPSFGAIAPVLAFFALARDDDTGRDLAKRLLAAGGRPAERAAARALRTLLRYLASPASDHPRIDVHRFPDDTPGWELLITAFTVHLHLRQPWVRASWAQRLGKRAILWNASGHRWLAGQTIALARMLDEQYAEQELSGLSIPAPTTLWSLVEPKPEWQRALEALSAVSESVVDAAERTVRVAWYVDAESGTLQRPALQEARPGQGFGAGQRLSIPELSARRDELPPEDQRVLDQLRVTPDDAWEPLIGHPRVFDGARGMRPIAVTRGSCRVITHDLGDSLRVEVEPAGLSSGDVHVRAEGDRLVVYRVSPAMRKVIETVPHGARIPKQHEVEVIRVLAKLAEVVEVHSPTLGAMHEATSDPAPILRFAPASGAWRVQLGVRPFGPNGRFLLAGLGPRTIVQNVQGRRLRAARDFDAELARRDAILAASPTLSRDEEDGPREPDGWIYGEEDVLKVLSELRAADVVVGFEWPESGGMHLRGTLGGKTLRARVQRLRGRKGWYLATGGLSIDAVTELSLADLARAPTVANGRFVRLPDGDFLEVEERIRKAMDALRARASARGELALPASAISSLEDLIAGGVDVDPEVHDWLATVREATAVEHPLPPLNATLRPYQLDGYQWLRRLGALDLGALLADDMGLGKTLQVIAYLASREGPALIVAPTSVVSNWERELARFWPAAKVVTWRGPTAIAPDAVVICSYAMLQQDEDELCAQTWDTVVLDEAQFIKNPDALRARAAFRLEARFRVALTGTPVENHYGELWSIFQFVLPGLLGDFATFKRRFVQAIESGSAANDVEAPEIALRRIVRPFVLRRRKDEVLTELPPLTEVALTVDLPERDELRYALLRKQIHDKLFTAHGRRHSKIQILAELTRLRRFCCHPRLVFPEAEPESAKIQAFLDLADELRENGHRALVFSQWVDFLSLVREQLDERRIDYEYLDGSTPAGARQARVDAFQQGSAPLFLVSLKAGGFGLNLTGADYVIHLDPWWNPAVEAQATDRAHRIGQDKPVTVYRLITRATIEEQIVELHRKKRRLFRSLLDESDGNVTVEELLRFLNDRRMIG